VWSAARRRKTQDATVARAGRIGAGPESAGRSAATGPSSTRSVDNPVGTLGLYGESDVEVRRPHAWHDVAGSHNG
jgi:hypothetical protein